MVTSVDGLKAGDVIAIASKENGNALGLTVSSNNRCENVAVKIISNAFEYVEGVAELSLEKEGTNWFFATADKKYLSTTSKRQLKYFEQKDSKSATIEFDKTGNALINFPAVDQTNIIRNNGEYGFAFYAPTTGEPVQIYKKQGSGKTATTLSFKNLVGEGVNLINGKLDGKDFNGYTAVVADNVEGSIAYTATGDGVATVDEKTGAVTVNPEVFGTTTITAKFTPKVTETYAASTAFYTITNIKSNNYATVADLRKDLNNGTLKVDGEVAVKLTDAKVLYVNQWTSNKVKHTQYFVREGNAAISFYDTGITMSNSAYVNGTFLGKIANLNGLLVLTKNNNTGSSVLDIKANTKPAVPIEISTDDIANYVCDLVTVKGATVKVGNDCALFNGNNLMPLYYNKFHSRTESLEAPYDNANVDLTSAIVLTYVNKQNELVYELAPTDDYSLVYNLSEESVNAIAAKTDVAVSLKRTFYKDGGWNTLCLPFAVNATDFEGAEVREVDVTQSSENTLVFKEATTIKAGKPYLIKWAKTPNEVCDFVNTFEGVTLVATATPVKVNDAITFTGFYNKATADKLGASVAAIGAGNKLFKVTSGEMKGFRAAFVLNPATPAAGIKVVIDGTTTGIEDLVVDGVKANGRVYNLNGQYVGNSLNGLQPGIYIQNGKKVVVK